MKDRTRVSEARSARETGAEGTCGGRTYTEAEIRTLWGRLKKDGQGLVCAVVTDAERGEVLMQAYQDEEAFRATLRRGLMHYRSRSRGCLWLKGETSGHFQRPVELRVDCDADCLLYRVAQSGAACHTGAYSCFYRRLDELLSD